jgi:hypothetical protein
MPLSIVIVVTDGALALADVCGALGDGVVLTFENGDTQGESGVSDFAHATCSAANVTRSAIRIGAHLS